MARHALWGGERKCFFSGKVTSVRYPDSSTITYVYDNYNRVTQAKAGNTILLSETYNLDDTVNKTTECNGNSTVWYAYNYRGWVTSIVARDKNNAVFLNLAYSYDNAGNVLAIKDNAGSAGTETYTYDALDRLTKAIGAWGTIQYGYDSVGNRLWINDGGNHTYSYTTYNKLTNDGTWSYAYDKNGNVIWKNSTTERYNYVYNSFGRMTSVIKWTKSGSTWSSSTIATYYYDANGQRARTVEGSATNNFVYQGIDTACQFGSDGKTNKYIYVGGQLQLRTCSASESYAYISDALGSTRFVLKNGIKDASNVVFSAVTYKPFGAVYTPSGTDRITFAGETTDSPTGLVYLSARYYDPSTGRFMALDPELGKLSMPQTLNRYVYCANSPLIHTDPTGRFWNIIGGAIIGAAIGGIMAFATGGDVIAGMVGGAVGGAIAGATFGTSTIASIGLSGLQIATISGTASGATEGAVSAYRSSGGDLGKTLEGAVIGGTIGGVTGAIGGATVGKYLSKTHIFENLADRVGIKLANLNTKMWADNEGVKWMSEKTADSIGWGAGVSSSVASLSIYKAPINGGIKAGVSYFTDLYQHTNHPSPEVSKAKSYLC